MPLGMEVSITYGDFAESLFKAFSRALTEVTNFLENCFRERLQVRYFSLNELRRMGHPYARRHYHFGKIGLTNLEKYALSLKYRKGYKGVLLSIINRQTGRLEDSLRKETKISYAGISYGRVYIDTVAVRYAPYVFFGTNRLIPRPIHLLVKAENEKEVIGRFKRLLGYYFYREYKTTKKKLTKTTRA